MADYLTLTEVDHTPSDVIVTPGKHTVFYTEGIKTYKE